MALKQFCSRTNSIFKLVYFACIAAIHAVVPVVNVNVHNSSTSLQYLPHHLLTYYGTVVVLLALVHYGTLYVCYNELQCMTKHVTCMHVHNMNYSIPLIYTHVLMVTFILVVPVIMCCVIYEQRARTRGVLITFKIYQFVKSVVLMEAPSKSAEKKVGQHVMHCCYIVSALAKKNMCKSYTPCMTLNTE